MLDDDDSFVSINGRSGCCYREFFFLEGVLTLFWGAVIVGKFYLQSPLIKCCKTRTSDLKKTCVCRSSPVAMLVFAPITMNVCIEYESTNSLYI